MTMTTTPNDDELPPWLLPGDEAVRIANEHRVRAGVVQAVAKAVHTDLRSENKQLRNELNALDKALRCEGLGPLPEPDMTMPSIAPDGPDGAHFYRARTVRQLLTAEQKRWADGVAGVTVRARGNTNE